MRSDVLVGLKYSGKKIPFTFLNDNLLQNKMSWSQRGDVIDVPMEDAEWMVKWSPSDFQMVYKSPVDAMKLPEPKPLFTDEGEDGEVSKSEEEKVDELFEKVAQKKGPGRPKKEDKDAS